MCLAPSIIPFIPSYSKERATFSPAILAFILCITIVRAPHPQARLKGWGPRVPAIILEEGGLRQEGVRKVPGGKRIFLHLSLTRIPESQPISTGLTHQT